jgi:hypothetical protein
LPPSLNSPAILKLSISPDSLSLNLLTLTATRREVRGGGSGEEEGRGTDAGEGASALLERANAWLEGLADDDVDVGDDVVAVFGKTDSRGGSDNEVAGNAKGQGDVGIGKDATAAVLSAGTSAAASVVSNAGMGFTSGAGNAGATTLSGSQAEGTM